MYIIGSTLGNVNATLHDINLSIFEYIVKIKMLGLRVEFL